MAVAAAVLLVGAAPAPGLAQADRISSRSVVRVTCYLPDNKVMVATGFVWQSAKQVVTALHAAVGCNPLLVKSQTTGNESRAVVERASLEADLALLSLQTELGVPPLAHATAAPNTRDAHFVWGFPNGVPEIRDYRVDFSGGQNAGVTTLKGAFAGDKDFDKMLSSQAFPLGSTAVLVIGSGVQSGQSGAPVFDAQGRVVEIVDGGIAGGWRGLNWGIPAYVYLPKLPTSSDPKPTTPSNWALLYSKVSQVSAPVPVPAGRADAGQLTRVRRVTLDDLDQQLRAKRIIDGNVTFIREVLNSPVEVAKLSFDIYEDPKSGAQLGVPTGMPLTWNPDSQVLEAHTPGGDARLFIGVTTAASHTQARSEAKVFADSLVTLARWKTSPATLAMKASGEWANNVDYFNGADAVSGAPVKVNLSLTADGPRFLGYALFGPEDIAKLPKAELVAYLMMQFAAQEVTSFGRN